MYFMAAILIYYKLVKAKRIMKIDSEYDAIIDYVFSLYKVNIKTVLSYTKRWNLAIVKNVKKRTNKSK